MTRPPSSFGTMLVINAKAIWAVCLGVLAWFIWPSTPEWWGLGLISILSALSGLALGIEAMKSAAKLYVRDKAIREYAALGSKPKTATMASNEALRKSGMM